MTQTVEASIGTHAGDNYSVWAVPLSGQPNPSTNKTIFVSEELTVWRRLWVEIDALQNAAGQLSILPSLTGLPIDQYRRACIDLVPYPQPAPSTIIATFEGIHFQLGNVNVLTTGFDAPNIDCVVLLRPTASPGLYYQCCGRGFRLHESKTDCLVLDYGGNILRHGPVDAIQVRDKSGKGSGDAPVKECPKCQLMVHAAVAVCPECGHEFPPPERETHDGSASHEGILSGEITDTEYDVQAVFLRCAGGVLRCPCQTRCR